MAPPPVRTAARLLWLIAGLALVRAGLLWFDTDAADGRTALALATLYTVVLPATVGLAVLRGLRWAQVLAVLICTLVMVGGLNSAFDAESLRFALLGVIGGVSAVVAVLLLLSAPARGFFRPAGRSPR